MRSSVFVLGRIGIRTGAALWRHRLTMLVGVFALAALGVYQVTFAGPSTTAGDCADTAMAAVTHIDDATARAAYACLGPDMRTTSEDQFVAGMRQRATPNARADRVADRRTANGGRIVFFTVHAMPGPDVGYIVYLDEDGKIAKVE
jgi:hypothetical protein